jgi:hypothetical protein
VGKVYRGPSTFLKKERAQAPRGLLSIKRKKIFPSAFAVGLFPWGNPWNLFGASLPGDRDTPHYVFANAKLFLESVGRLLSTLGKEWVMEHFALVLRIW